MPHPKKWFFKAIRDVAATPWSQHGASLPGVVRLDPNNAGEEERKERLPQARRVYIRQADLSAHGYKKNCPKCQCVIVYGLSSQSSTPHSEECRR